MPKASSGERGALQRWIARARATVVGGWVFLYLLTGGLFNVLRSLLTGEVKYVYRGARWSMEVALRLAGVEAVVRGAENFPRGQCIYMANHQSNIDPPIVFTVLPERIAFMGKKQLWSVPILGTALRLGEFIPVHREVKEEARASVEEALEVLRRGTVSLMVYPEGTRSFDGRLLPFKGGVFLLAIRSGLPIVPCTLDGATDVMPKAIWQVYPKVVTVTIHAPIETRGLTEDERYRLAERVRAAIASALPEGLQGTQDG
ncbi:MAG: lysophospholipid acyltransferase family protein [Candidatus Acidiferrales bacterium]